MKRESYPPDKATAPTHKIGKHAGENQVRGRL